MKSVGIDIGNFSVKLAEIEASSSAYSLRRFEEYAFSPDPQRDRQLQLIEILRAIAALYDAGSARFTIALPQHLSSGRLRRFPFRERPKILKSLPFELEDDIPLDPEETIFDAKIVEFVGNAAQAWCVAAPREAVRETLKSSLEGSIDPDIVCLEGLALANLFERWQLPPAEIPPERAAMFALAASADDAATAALPERPARVILALGHVRTLVLIYRDGSLCSARSIQWGGQEIANSIASVFNVPYYEALKVLQTKSFILLKKEGATRDQIGLSKAISDSVDNLIRPLKLALLESKSELGLAYNEIELLGGASQIQHLAPYLTNALEIPCNLALPLASLRGMTIPDTPQTQASSAVAVGLAIEGLKRPRNPPLNLRRGELARENQNLKRLWAKWGTTAKVAASAFALICVHAIVRDTIASSTADKAEETLLVLGKNVAGLPKPSDAAIQKHVDRDKKMIKARETLAALDGFDSSLDLLTRISQSVPSVDGGSKVEMNVSSFDVDNEDVFIQGTIDSKHRANLKNWLQKAAKPGSVKEASVQGPVPKGFFGAPFAYVMKASRIQ